MKKILGLLFVAFLVLGAAGQASAYFERGDLIISLSNDSEEMLVDLGVGSDIDWDGTDVVLGNVGDYSAYTDVQVAYYSTNGTGVYTLPGTEASVTFAGFASFTAAMNTVYAQGMTNSAATDTDTLYYTPTSDTGSMLYNMGSAWGNLVSTTSATDVDETLYVYYMNIPVASTDVVVDGLAGTEYYATITLADNGDVVLNASAVPVPGAVWLLGSAVLGLVGVRKKNA